jgi:hypothetical protein
VIIGQASENTAFRFLWRGKAPPQNQIAQHLKGGPFDEKKVPRVPLLCGFRTIISLLSTL